MKDIFTLITEGSSIVGPGALTGIVASKGGALYTQSSMDTWTASAT